MKCLTLEFSFSFSVEWDLLSVLNSCFSHIVPYCIRNRGEKNHTFFKGTSLKILRSLSVEKLKSWAHPNPSLTADRTRRASLLYSLLKLLRPGVWVEVFRRPQAPRGSRVGSPRDTRRLWNWETIDVFHTYSSLLHFTKQTLSSYVHHFIFLYAQNLKGFAYLNKHLFCL